MGNPKPFPVYWDKILINASQVTNPSIDPLREPMETRTYLGKKPQRVSRNAEGKLDCQLPPQLDLSMPVMFSAMSYGSIVAFRAKCKMFSRHLQKPILKTEKGRFKGL